MRSIEYRIDVQLGNGPFEEIGTWEPPMPPVDPPAHQLNDQIIAFSDGQEPWGTQLVLRLTRIH